MEKQSIREKNLGWLEINAILIGVVWTLVLVGLLVWNLQGHKKHLLESVTRYARSSYNRDVVYRHWMAIHGGVYVPPTAETPPNPYLAKLPRRDVTTATGMKLTLINPAYMTRQVFELGRQQYGYQGHQGHITSLKPLRPGNRPDSWEKKALSMFEAGTSEVVEVQVLDGDRYLRLMRPLVTEKGCLKCHADQGCKPGDILGGISISVNLKPILAVAHRHWQTVGYWYGAVWLLGLLGIFFVYFRSSKNLQRFGIQEKLLRQSRDHFKTFFQRAPVGFQSVAEDGTVLEVNETWLVLLGYQVDEVVGKKFAAFLGPESVAEYRLFFAQFKVAGHMEGVVLDLKRRDGRIIKGNYYGRVEYGAKGTFQRTICVFYDITENFKQQETIAELQRRNAEILGAAGEGILVLDMERRHTFINPAALEMLGYTPEELLGRDSHETWHRSVDSDDISVQGSCLICLAIEKGAKKSRVITSLWRRDGTSFPAELTLSTIREGGNPTATVVVFNDISERLEEQKRLSLLAAVVEQKDSIVVIFDHQGNITYLNPAFERITGYLVTEMQGKNVYEVFSPGLEYDSSRQELKLCLSRGEVWHGVLQSKKKDGTIFDDETVAFPIEDGHGLIIGYAAIKRDISAQKKLEQQLSQASRMESIGHLAGGVAHDFNNILTVINGYAQLVQMKLEEGSRLWHDVREIEKAGDRAAGLTRQLLTFSRKQVIMPASLRVNEEIVEMEKMLRRLIGEDIELKLSLSENLPLIYADPSQLQQILLNLVVNARDALGEEVPGDEKRIIISTFRKLLDDEYVHLHPGCHHGWHVQIQVEDTGAGMSKEVAGHVFEPFYTTKEVGQGTGMGLATVYGIVKQNRGCVYVYSEPGQGSTFKVYWPVMEGESRLKEKGIDESPAGGDEVILLAEDDEALRKVGSRQLRQAGYMVIEAADGKDALEKARRHQGPIDLLFTDVVMPVMGGMELSEAIVDVHPGIVVLFASGYPDDRIRQMIVELGKERFINKPYGIKDILGRVRSLLDARYG